MRSLLMLREAISKMPGIRRSARMRCSESSFTICKLRFLCSSSRTSPSSRLFLRWLLVFIVLPGCASHTLFIAEQGRPEGFEQRLEQALAQHKNWRAEYFSNRFNPPKTTLPLAVYGAGVDPLDISRLLQQVGVPQFELQLNRSPGHRATADNVVLYFPLTQEIVDQERLQFSVTCGQFLTDIYTRGDGSARLSDSEWLPESERWRVISESDGQWRQSGAVMEIVEFGPQRQWRFTFNTDPDRPLDWELGNADSAEECWGHAYHLAPPAGFVEHTAKQ